MQRSCGRLRRRHPKGHVVHRTAQSARHDARQNEPAGGCSGYDSCTVALRSICLQPYHEQGNPNSNTAIRRPKYCLTVISAFRNELQCLKSGRHSRQYNTGWHLLICQSVRPASQSECSLLCYSPYVMHISDAMKAKTE
jgi:hypothetical protein